MTSGHAATDDPERALWTAVITQAIHDARGKVASAEGLRERDRARSWFLTAGADFQQVCALAGFDPEWVRDQALTVWTQKEAAE